MKRYKLTITLMILCVISLYLISNLYLFPDKINILAGATNSVRLNPLFCGAIEGGEVETLNINNTPISDNINIDLRKQFLIETNEVSQLKMVLKLFGIPLKTVTVDTIPDEEVVPCGMTVGILIDTDGILVLGTGYVNGIDGKAHYPSEGVLKSGDSILEANGKPLKSNEDLMKAIEESDGKIVFKIDRDDEVIEKEVTAVKNMDDGKYKIGIWVRDSTKGIGTITYYNPTTMEFAALGHGIMDIDTKRLMSVRSGNIMQTEITKIKKGKKGSPGELVGDINSNKFIGTITKNTAYGIYGKLEESFAENMLKETMKISLQGEVKEGPAVIYSNINGKEIEKFDVYIENLNRYSNDDSKGIVLRIVDPRLLQKTSGIVQGMSGSPIIQNDKLIGAVTHVFVQEPSKGYGIFIENMMKLGKSEV